MMIALYEIVKWYFVKRYRLNFLFLLVITGLLGIVTILHDALNSNINYSSVLYRPTIQNETTRRQQGELHFIDQTALTQFMDAQLPAEATIVLIGTQEISVVNRPVVHLAYNVLTDADSLEIALHNIRQPYIFLRPSSLLGWRDAIVFLKSSSPALFPHRYLQFILRAEPFIILRYTDYSDREHFSDNDSLALSFGAKRLLSQYDYSLQVDAAHKPVRCVTRAEKMGDALAYTPPITLPVGPHSIDIFLSQQGGASQGDVALLDIFSGGKRLSELMVYPSDFLQENQYQRFSVEFVVEQENELLEARVFFLGSVDLCVQGIRFLH